MRSRFFASSYESACFCIGAACMVEAAGAAMPFAFGAITGRVRAAAQAVAPAYPSARARRTRPAVPAALAYAAADSRSAGTGFESTCAGGDGICRYTASSAAGGCGEVVRAVGSRMRTMSACGASDAAGTAGGNGRNRRRCRSRAPAWRRCPCPRSSAGRGRRDGDRVAVVAVADRAAARMRIQLRRRAGQGVAGQRLGQRALVGVQRIGNAVHGASLARSLSIA